MKRLSTVGAALLIVALALGCGSDGRTVKVGSKDFIEQFILGEMYALVLENAGFRVERRLNLGGTPIAHAGLLGGEIDLYPEYTGTGLMTVLKLPANGDRRQVFDTVARGYEDRFGLVWLDPAPMNNTSVFAMTRGGSARHGIRTISDFVSRAGELTLIGPPEFEEREDGLPALRRVYGDVTIGRFVAVDPGLRYQGLTSGQADVVGAFGTDGEINALDLVVLEDDKGMFPPYQVAPVVRHAALDANPGLGEALNALAPKLTDAAMRRLNYEVSGHRREPADVARAFLVAEGLLK